MLVEFKNNTVSYPTIIFPDEVYKAVMGRINIEYAPKLTSNDYESNIIEKISEWIANILDTKDDSVTVDGVKYKISSVLGTTANVAEITVDETKYILTWNPTTATEDTLSDFLERVVDLGKEYSDVAKWVSKDILANALNGTLQTLSRILVTKENIGGSEVIGYIQKILDVDDADGSTNFVGNTYNELYDFIKENFDNVIQPIDEVSDKVIDFQKSASILIEDIDNDKELTENSALYIAEMESPIKLNFILF